MSDVHAARHAAWIATLRCPPDASAEEKREAASDAWDREIDAKRKGGSEDGDCE